VRRREVECRVQKIIGVVAQSAGNPVLFNDPDGLLAKQAWNSVTEPFTQARALADRTQDDATPIALTMSGGDKNVASSLLWNGHELENFVQKNYGEWCSRLDVESVL